MNQETKIIATKDILGKVVQVYGTHDEPLFLAKDVSDWIGHSDVSMMLRQVDDDEKLIQVLFVSGQNRSVSLLTEDGLYEVLFLSRKPIAKAFKKEVKRILSELRRHGITATHQKIEELLSDPDSWIKALQTIKEERQAKDKAIQEAKEQKIRADLNEQKAILANNQVRQLRPKAELMEKVIDMDENVDIGQVAKILELSYGRNTLFKKLKKSGIFFKNRNEPKQQYVEAGYFKLKEHIIPRENHPDLLVIKVLVTQKGLDWLAQKLGVIESNKQLALIQ